MQLVEVNMRHFEEIAGYLWRNTTVLEKVVVLLLGAHVVFSSLGERQLSNKTSIAIRT